MKMVVRSGTTRTGGQQEEDDGKEHFEQLPARVGEAYQIPGKDIPCAFTTDPSVEAGIRGPVREGDDRCRWKLPPFGKSMPSTEDVETFVAAFAPELEELVHGWIWLFRSMEEGSCVWAYE